MFKPEGGMRWAAPTRHVTETSGRWRWNTWNEIELLIPLMRCSSVQPAASCAPPSLSKLMSRRHHVSLSALPLATRQHTHTSCVKPSRTAPYRTARNGKTHGRCFLCVCVSQTVKCLVVMVLFLSVSLCSSLVLRCFGNFLPPPFKQPHECPTVFSSRFSHFIYACFHMWSFKLWSFMCKRYSNVVSNGWSKPLCLTSTLQWANFLLHSVKVLMRSLLSLVCSLSVWCLVINDWYVVLLNLF